MSYNLPIYKTEYCYQLSTEVKIWGKVFQILFHKDRKSSGINTIFIYNDWKKECPKCEFSYGDVKHGKCVTCCKCGATYTFHGALHPEPTGSTKAEFLEAEYPKGVIANEWI